MKKLKENKAISLAILAIFVTLFVLVGAIVTVVILENQKTNKPANNLENTVVVNPNENRQVENKQDNNTAIVEPLNFTLEYLKSGKTTGDVKVIQNDLENTIVLSITGAATNDIDGTSLVSGKNKWYKTIDLTNYNTLEFYARKGHDNGDLMVGIDKNIVKRVRFQDFPNIWTKYTIDVSGYEGEHIVTLAGGYADMSGSPESNTEYRSIKLK